MKGTQIDASNSESTDPKSQVVERKSDLVVETGVDDGDKGEEEEEVKTVCECCGFRLPNTALGQSDFHYPCNELCGNLWYVIDLYSTLFLFFFFIVLVTHTHIHTSTINKTIGTVHHQNSPIHIEQVMYNLRHRLL